MKNSIDNSEQSSKKMARSSRSRSKLAINGPEIQSFLTPKSERSSNIKECEKKHRKPTHMITSMEKNPASPMKHHSCSSKRSLQMSVSPKNSRGGSGCPQNPTDGRASPPKRSQASGSKTARNKEAGGFNFRIEILNEEEKNPELRSSSNLVH